MNYVLQEQYYQILLLIFLQTKGAVLVNATKQSRFFYFLSFCRRRQNDKNAGNTPSNHIVHVHGMI